MSDQAARVQVGPGGPVVKLAVVGTRGREVDVTSLSEIFAFDEFTQSVADVASAMTTALRRARPDEAEVTFGIDATVETGKLTSMLVKGKGTATFEVRLLWRAGVSAAEEDGSAAQGSGNAAE